MRWAGLMQVWRLVVSPNMWALTMIVAVFVLSPT
jgi:hypothetical protein